MKNNNCVDINGLNIEHSKCDQLLKGLIESLITVAKSHDLTSAYSETIYYDEFVNYCFNLEVNNDEFMIDAFIKWGIRNYEQNNEEVFIGWRIATVISEVYEEKNFNIEDGINFVIKFIKFAASKLNDN